MNPTALIAEDEPLLAQALRDELKALWPELDVVAMSPNGVRAQQDLLALMPDIAFLDVRMPGSSGVEVAQALAEDWSDDGRPPPLLVFVTAYEQFALEAFRQAAVDYVLKPVQPVRLAQTVQRLKARLAERASAQGGADGAGSPGGPGSIDALAEQLRRLLEAGSGGIASGPAAGPAAIGAGALPGRPAAPPLRVIRAGVGDSVRLVPIDDVVYLQATDKYVNVVTDGHEHLIREPLRDLLPRLDPQRFTQIHRGTVVNLDRVETASRDEAGKLWLSLRGRKERLGVSRLYVHLFKAM